jgi:hypothetical protein
MFPGTSGRPYTTGSLIVDGGLMLGVAEFNRAAAS